VSDDIRRRLLTDLTFYAPAQLKIMPKSGGRAIPFDLNRAQAYLHDRLEDQRKRTGKVRAIILKGRQQGCSTYVGARYYHKTVCNHGLLTFIFAHDTAASESLYGMVQNYYDLSDPSFRPELGARNHKELLFPVLKSGYKVGTAGTKGLGRSKTFQMVHWSEVAYSPNAADHAAGILQTVADLPDTEIILESTANGEGDYFHLAAMQAIAGVGDFELIFIPWYWQQEYTRRTPPDFALEQPKDDEDFTSEQEYMDLFHKDGLTFEHLAWRRAKIAEFNGEVSRFMHEYPFTPEEAFAASSAESYIKALTIKKARQTAPIQSNAPMVFGVDPAALGGDKFKVCHRKGRTVTKVDTYPAMYPHESARRLAQDIQKYRPMRVNIDVGGLGIGVYGCLIDMGYGNIVHKVNFGGASSDPDNNYRYVDEMFRGAWNWFADGPVSIACDEKNAAAIQSEISGRKHKWHNNSQLRMEPKAEFKKRMQYSPDTGDSFLLTFAELLPENPQLRPGMNGQTMQAGIEGWDPFK
jgi:hypothetical protein